MQFFLTVGQNNFGNQIPFLISSAFKTIIAVNPNDNRTPLSFELIGKQKEIM